MPNFEPFYCGSSILSFKQTNKQKNRHVFFPLFLSLSLTKVTKHKTATCRAPQFGDFFYFSRGFQLEQETWGNVMAGRGEWSEKR